MMSNSMMTTFIVILIGLGAGLMGYGYWLLRRQRAVEAHAATLVAYQASLAEHEASNGYGHSNHENTIVLHDEVMKNGGRR